MSRTRPPTRRMLAFRQSLLAGKYPNASTLAEQFEVTTRTAQRDIEYVRDQLVWPIEYDAEHRGYAADGPLPMPDAVVTEGDLLAVLVALPLVARYRGTAYWKRLKNVFDRLCAGLPEEIDVRLSELDQSLSVHGTAVPAVEPEVMESIQDAITSHRTLHLVYQTMSRGGETTERDVDPYHLACIDGHWYLIARCHLRGEIRVFSAWRIQSASLSEKNFHRPREFNAGDYLAKSFRVFQGGRSVNVVLRFSGLAASLLRERDVPAEKRRRDLRDGRLEITLGLAGLEEVLWWVLGFGAECEVVRPKKLREMILGHARAMLQTYSRRLRNDRRERKR